MLTDKASPGNNDLLAALPLREREGILKDAERVTLVQDEILGEPGARIHHAWFFLDGFVALLAEVDQHDALAVALIGNEGMLGAPLALGVPTSPLRARVQGSGTALRIKSADFQRALVDTPVLERQLRRYAGIQLEQFAQTAACASFHVVDARLACWLLMSHDRVLHDRFYLTHDRLARLLGVRRSGVTTAAGVLQDRDLIGYTRGHIVILDRAGLEGASCSCYRAARETARPRGERDAGDVRGSVIHVPPPDPAPAPVVGVVPHRPRVRQTLA